jgi:hypothetical protein
VSKRLTSFHNLSAVEGKQTVCFVGTLSAAEYHMEGKCALCHRKILSKAEEHMLQSQLRTNKTIPQLESKVL